MLIWLALCWMLGVVMAGVGVLGSVQAAGAALCGLLATALARRTALRSTALGLLCLGLGALRYQSSLPTLGPGRVEQLVGANTVLRGTVVEDPRRDEQGQRVVLQVERASQTGRAAAVEGRVLLILPPYPAYRYGERLLAEGVLSAPRAASRPGEFDYRAYLAHRGIGVLMREPERVQRLNGRDGHPLLTALLDIRAHCRAILLRSLPEPQAALAVGILLGIQSSIPDEVYGTFQATGTSHILVVSGWNFTIVAAVLASVCVRLHLRRWPAFWLTLAAMWAYAIFTGGSAAVLRAAAMASLAALARGAERSSEPWRLLLGGCWALSIANPHTLWDLGFQLSALATASLFAFGQATDAWVGRLAPLHMPALAPLREALTATLAAQVLTLPLILYHFGNLSIVAPLANVLLVPAVPYAMLLCTVALLGGLLWLPLGQWLASAAWLPLSWLAEGARLLATPRWAAVQIPPFPLWMLLTYYAVVLALYYWRHLVGRRDAPTTAMVDKRVPHAAP